MVARRLARSGGLMVRHSTRDMVKLLNAPIEGNRYRYRAGRFGTRYETQNADTQSRMMVTDMDEMLERNWDLLRARFKPPLVRCRCLK